MKMKTIVRKATKKDLKDVVRLWIELINYHNHLDKRFWNRAANGPAKFQEWMKQSLTDSKRILLVAELSGNVVGFTHGMLKQSPPPMQPRLGGFVTDFVISKAVRREGLGSKILKKLEAWFIAKGAKEITLTSAAKNLPAMSFWAKKGFDHWTFTMWKPLRNPGTRNN